MSEWVRDNPKERAEVEARYTSMIHRQYVDEHPEFIPACPCHRETRNERLENRKGNHEAQ